MNTVNQSEASSYLTAKTPDDRVLCHLLGISGTEQSDVSEGEQVLMVALQCDWSVL